MRKIFLLLALSLASICHAQEGNTLTIPFSGATPSTCAFPQVYYNTGTGVFYDCVLGVPTARGGGGGSGTVTSITFSAPLTGGTITTSGTVGLTAPSLDVVTGSAAQATGTETLAGHNYTWAGIETTALVSPFVFQNTNSTNNNTSTAMIANAAGTGTGGIAGMFNCVSTAAGSDCVQFYSGSTVSNGTLSGGTLKSHITAGGTVIALGFEAGTSGSYEGTSTTNGIVVQGGQDTGANSALGGIASRGADQTGAGGATSAGGNNLVRGGNNAGTNTSSEGGSLFLEAGQSTGATTGKQGLISAAGSEVGASTPVQWNLMCPSSTTAMTITNCGASPGNWMGIAETVNAVTTIYIFSGYTLVNASAAVTIGDTVCASTTAGQVTDSGGTTACAVGSQVGIVRATSGTFKLGDGTSITPTTTLPLILIARD